MHHSIYIPASMTTLLHSAHPFLESSTMSNKLHHNLATSTLKQPRTSLHWNPAPVKTFLLRYVQLLPNVQCKQQSSSSCLTFTFYLLKMHHIFTLFAQVLIISSNMCVIILS